MIELTTVTGEKIDVAENSISLVTGPSPSEAGPRAHVYGPGPGSQIIAEAPQLLIARLRKPKTFAVFHRPNGTPVWVRASAVSTIRAPLSTETGPRTGVVRAVLQVGGIHQAVQEDVNTAKQIVAAHLPRAK
jgi:hypothetical protein